MEAKQVKDLMEAYSSIYIQSEQEVLSEDLQGAVEKGLKAAGENPVIKAIGKVIAPVGSGRGTVTQAQQKANIERNKQEDVDFSDHSGENLEEETPKIIGLQPASPRMVKGYPLGSSKVHDPSKMKDKKVKRVAEETDLFDYILEHLVAEGYADTNKAALAIMANMSEEWKQSIVEAVYGGGQSPTDTPADTNKKMVVTNADKLGNTPAYQRLKAGDDRYVAAPHLKGV